MPNPQRIVMTELCRQYNKIASLHCKTIPWRMWIFNFQSKKKRKEKRQAGICIDFSIISRRWSSYDGGTTPACNTVWCSFTFSIMKKKKNQNILSFSFLNKFSKQTIKIIKMTLIMIPLAVLTFAYREHSKWKDPCYKCSSTSPNLIIPNLIICKISKQ